MKKLKMVMSRQTATTSEEKRKEKSLAKKFFPLYISKVTSVINTIHKIHPKTSCWMTAKLLSVAGRRRLSSDDIMFYKKGIKSQFKIGKATFCTYTYGNGPAILMLHGWCSNGARWRSYVHQLVDLGYKVVVVDAPGHGNAPGRFLSVSLYVKGIKTILESESKWHAVITHSIAGLAGITAIGNSEKKHHPSKFIMMNTFATATSMMEKFSRCLGISEEVIKGTKEWMSNYTEYPLEQLSISKHYKNINGQGLLIYDTEDIVVPRKESEYIIRHVKPLEFIQTKGLGHNLRSTSIVKKALNFVGNKTDNVVENELINEGLMTICV